MDVDEGNASGEDEQYEYSDDDDEYQYYEQDDEYEYEMDADEEEEQQEQEDYDSYQNSNNNVTSSSTLEKEGIASMGKYNKNNNNNEDVAQDHHHHHQDRPPPKRRFSKIKVERSTTDRNVKMYTTDEVVPIMKRAIDEITEVLAVPTAAAQPLLRHHKWLKDRLFNAYTDDAEKETKAAGVFFRCGNNDHNNNNTNNEKNGRIQSKNHQHQPQCDICFSDELEPNDMLAMSCGHEFCKVCWSGHIKAKLETGPAAILATCPQHKCTELFTEDEVAIAAPDLLAKYQGYQLRNFVEMNGKSRWCPGAGCDRIAAIQSTNGNLSDAETVLVTCNKCTTCFCLKCGNEPHSPLSCATLVTWNDKCKNESETANWILANTKPCPNCRARIEKNQGCNHMTCQHCNYHFCWICSGDWKEHGANTGGYYNCNKFDDTDNAEEDQSDAAKAKRELDRYLHYYKRYHAHAEAQKYAMKQLDDIGVKMMALQECQSDSTWSDVEFLKTANEQLVACRRVLKFTYVFGYYMTTPVKKPESKVEEASTDVKPLKGKRKASSKDTKTDNTNSIEEILSIDEQMKKMRKERFEYHQEMLERFTENLSEMVEKSYKDIDRTEVVNQTRVVKNFLQKILEYVENGLEDN